MKTCDQERQDRLNRLATAAILMDLLKLPTLKADRMARAASPEIRRRICREAQWPIRNQAAAAIEQLARRIPGFSEKKTESNERSA